MTANGPNDPAMYRTMPSVRAQIDRLKERRPQGAELRGESLPFPLSSSFFEPASTDEIADLRLDAGLHDFWTIAGSAELFEDTTYGQWGLHILTPGAAQKLTAEQLVDRERDFRRTDLVVGRFHGDSDLLVMDGATLKGSACVWRVALPLDARADWPIVASSFSKFLERYIEAEGDKYWEVSGQPH